MSDRHLHDDSQDQSWTGGPIEAQDMARERVAEPPCPQTLQDEPGDEREAGYLSYYLGRPPLLDASWGRLELCRDALALVLLDAGVPMSKATYLAARCVARLQEPLE